VAQARERGFAVVSARVGQAEPVLGYAAVADLLGNVDPALFAELPDVQQVAVDRVLLRSSSEGPQTDHRVVAAALASSVERLAVRTPVLIAIDDVQWLDPSSQAVISFAACRFDGRVGILVTERCDADSGTSALWLHLGRPDGLDRLTVSALSLGGLHALISARLGRTFARPTMVRIAEISGGNPFYALELARAIDMGSANALETARNTCRADAHAHQPARSRRQGPPPGCGIRRDADRGTARASRRHHVRASCRAAFGGTSQGHPRD